MPKFAIALTLAVAALAVPAGAGAACPTSWKLTGSEIFKWQDTLMRSQGVTSDGQSWTFSWQGGLERTTDQFVPTALGTLPVQADDTPSFDTDGRNHVGPSHIGDIDTDSGLIYAPAEDGNQDVGVATINDPEYQAPHIALYDALTLLYTGKSYKVPVATNGDGVPWIAIDHKRRELYTGEWNMPNDRLNVFDMQMRFKRFLRLKGVHLNRIQGGEIRGHTMYVARDDADKTVFAIDVRTGAVTKLFSLDHPATSELEGIAVRPMADGSLLHVLLVENNDLPDQVMDIDVKFEHFAPVCRG
jgi:hypothetical protein